MKKIFMFQYYILLFLFTIISCTKETVDNDLPPTSNDNFDGPVKSFTELVYTNNNVLTSKIETQFSEDGNKTETSEFNYSISLKKFYLSRRSEFIYNTDRKLIEIKNYNSAEDLEHTHVYKYNAEGNNYETEVKHSDGSLFWKYLHFFDANQYKIEKRVHSSGGSLVVRYLYTNDELGRPITEVEVSPNGLTTNYKYDGKGNHFEVKIYNKDGSLRNEYSYDYKYNRRDNWIERLTYTNNTFSEKSVRTYTYYH
jgi:hypothetical protein